MSLDMALSEAIVCLEEGGVALCSREQILEWLKELRDRRLEALHTVSDEEVKRLWEDYKARRIAETQEENGVDVWAEFKVGLGL